MRTLLIIFSFVTCLTATAGEGLHENFNPTVELFKSDSWKAVRKLVGTKVRLEISRKGKTSIFQPPVGSSMLMRAHTQKWGASEYLITLWQEGVHTTVLRIFNPTQAKPMIWEKYSVGQLSYEATDSGLSVNVNDIQPGTIETQETTVIWKAGQ